MDCPRSQFYLTTPGCKTYIVTWGGGSELNFKLSLGGGSQSVTELLPHAPGSVDSGNWQQKWTFAGLGEAWQMPPLAEASLPLPCPPCHCHLPLLRQNRPSTCPDCTRLVLCCFYLVAAFMDIGGLGLPFLINNLKLHFNFYLR